MPGHRERLKDSLWELVLSIHPLGSRYQTQGTMLVTGTLMHRDIFLVQPLLCCLFACVSFRCLTQDLMVHQWEWGQAAKWQRSPSSMFFYVGCHQKFPDLQWVFWPQIIWIQGESSSSVSSSVFCHSQVPHKYAKLLGLACGCHVQVQAWEAAWSWKRRGNLGGSRNNGTKTC